MKIALTADLHLTSRDVHPSRYEALENILQHMLDEDVRVLVIAGDVFDRAQAHVADFDQVCRDVRDQGIEVWVIPGNHDTHLKPRMLTAENIHVVIEPQWVTFAPGTPPVLLLPYEMKSMGEALAPLAGSFTPRGWVLVAHGDYISAIRGPHPLEPGVYMPLTARDLREYAPRRTFLGHIHKPYDGDTLHYMGSPCSLDPNETGRRRFLLYDLEQDAVESRHILAGPLRFSVDLVCLPGEGELAYLSEEMERVVRSWELSSDEKKRVEVRVKVRGAAYDRSAVANSVEKYFAAYHLDGDVDTSQLDVADDVDRTRIVTRVMTLVDELDWRFEDDGLSRDDVKAAALKTIYGV